MGIDFQRYLESICRKYQQWWSLVDKLTNTVALQKADGEELSSLFDFGLMAQIIEPKQRQNEISEKTERLSVLEGLRKYAANESVLLIGRPGAGKSTTLARLLVESAKEALQNQQSQIPVLVELRYYKDYYKTSVLDLVQAFLKRHKLRLDISTLEDLLFEGQFLLLMDGINELPDDNARTNIKLFCRDNSHTPMIFTTRDGGDDLGIRKKLEMQPLSDIEVQRFIDDCMPGQTREILQQLRDRLRELGQTPLVMWMLYFIFQKTQDVPLSSGAALREFTQLYERKSKDDVPVTEKSRRWWSGLLAHLAFEMMQADKPTDFRLSISEKEAEKNFGEFLQGKDELPASLAKICLKDLLKHHLIQRNPQNDEIEFCHQLLQEYYAAESLLQRLDQISPEQLKYYYLNYLKWTEPLSLMLALPEVTQKKAVEIVSLALNVDLNLGAKLAGSVKTKVQEETVGLIAERTEIHQRLKLWLLGITRSNYAISILSKSLENKDDGIRYFANQALGKIGSEATITFLSKALEDENSYIRFDAWDSLDNIGTEAIIPSVKQALKNQDWLISWEAIHRLGNMLREAAIPDLIEALARQDPAHGLAIQMLGHICGKNNISELIQYLENKGFQINKSVIVAIKSLPEFYCSILSPPKKRLLGRLGYSSPYSFQIDKMCDEPTVFELCQNLENEDPDIRKVAVYLLGKLGNEEAINALLKALESEYWRVRFDSVHWLGKIASHNHNEIIFTCLLKAINDENGDVAGCAASVLATSAIPELLPDLSEMLLKFENSFSGILEVILAIQGRCKYYNYIIATSPPPEKENNTDPLTNQLTNSINTLAQNIKTMSEQPKVSMNFHAPITGSSVAGNVEGDSIGTQNNYPSAQNIAEVETVIQKLLEQIEQNKPTPIEAELIVNQAVDNYPVLKDKQVIEQAIKNYPNLKIRLRRVATAVGIETVKVIFAPAGILIEGVKAWTQHE
ncbi:HEAT repeat domain-containing protein [Anabaena sphaerica FACHB-251]|uniref:HEAT repeat domain-containing protein n=1 Tax=Anabaena sphaerica FACHB-251 TaxID=2692883 RepID=A0A927A1P3_9NOST|nr:HEAT repeat domain-containing protein [Anabaena sphaerica]MBD2294351.1 HEAT repeat domain-containing protein [Anabaena sphaerica FACHB-251]